MKSRVGLIGMVLTIILLAGCAQAAPEPVTYTIEMSEFAFSPDTIEVQVGQPVTIEMVNVGALEHELMLGRTVTKRNNRPNGFEQDFFEAAGIEPHVEEMIAGSREGEASDMEDDMHMEDHEGFMISLPKTGDRATLTFTPTEDAAGEWEIGCFEQEGVHYDAGMKGTLVVRP